MGFSTQEYWGVGCHFLLQGILLTQGSNPCLLCLLHYRWIPNPLSHRVNPLLLGSLQKGTFRVVSGTDHCGRPAWQWPTMGGPLLASLWPWVSLWVPMAQLWSPVGWPLGSWCELSPPLASVSGWASRSFGCSVRVQDSRVWTKTLCGSIRSVKGHDSWTQSRDYLWYVYCSSLYFRLTGCPSLSFSPTKGRYVHLRSWRFSEER